jgi:hypothetical protein
MSVCNPPLGSFHWRDNLFFRLTDDRSVHIFKLAPGGELETIALIPILEWGSILGALARTAKASS